MERATAQHLEYNDKMTIRASEHFGIDENEVTPKHIQFIKDQDFANNYGYMGNPLVSYEVGEDGFVEFTRESSEVLSNQWDHRFGKVDV